MRFRRLASLSLAFAIAGCKTSGTPEDGAALKEDQTQTPNLDQRILEYQIDAMMCGVSALTAGFSDQAAVPTVTKCLVASGIAVGSVISQVRTCADRTHRKTTGSFTDCMKTAPSSWNANAAAIKCLTSEAAAQTALSKMGVLGSIVGCSLTVVNGVSLLNEAIVGANQQRDLARQSADDVKNAIARMSGSRIYNQGFYRGCHTALNVAKGDDNRCRQHCDTFYNGFSGASFTASERSYHNRAACYAGCVATEAVPRSWVATLFDGSPKLEREGCKLVVQKGKSDPAGIKAINFRGINWPGVEQQATAAEKYRTVKAWKIRISASLAALDAAWGSLPKHPGHDLITLDTIRALETSEDQALVLAAQTFTSELYGQVNQGGNQGTQPQFGGLLDTTATPNNADGLVSRGDLADFGEEIRTYYYPCEADQATCATL